MFVFDAASTEVFVFMCVSYTPCLIQILKQIYKHKDWPLIHCSEVLYNAAFTCVCVVESKPDDKQETSTNVVEAAE